MMKSNRLTTVFPFKDRSYLCSAEINDWNVSAASNNSTAPDGWPETTMTINQINNTGREGMAVVARWHKDTNATITSTGSGGDYVVAPNQTLSSLYDGFIISFKANHTNSGAATLDVGLGATALRAFSAGDLIAEEIVADQLVWARFNGADWRMIPYSIQALQLRSIDAGAGGNEPTLRLFRDSATPAASDVLGAVVYEGDDSGGSRTIYGRTSGIITDPTDTSEDGGIVIETMTGGTLSAKFNFVAGMWSENATGGDPGTESANIAGDYQKNGGVVSATTADIKAAMKTTADTGWLLLDGSTIGSAASAADYAAADAVALFTSLWTDLADSEAPVSGGRGGSAAADFAANKTLTLTDARGRSPLGAGTGAAPDTLTARTLGDTLGEEDHVLTTAELPAAPATFPVGTGTGATSALFQGDSNSSDNTDNLGSDDPHNTMHPSFVVNWFIKL